MDKKTGAKNILIHFDMDVLDQNEIFAAVGVVPDGMKISEVVRVIKDTNNNFNVVSLTVEEPMSRIVIRPKKMLERLPFIDEIIILLSFILVKRVNKCAISLIC